MKLDRRNEPVTITDFRQMGSHESRERATAMAWLMVLAIIAAIVIGAVSI